MFRRAMLAVSAAALGLAPLGALAQAPAVIGGLKPANPQPANLQPGLAVTYKYGKIDRMSQFIDEPGEVGAPLPRLDYRMGADKVLTSRHEDGVQARITGFIRFPAAGVHTLHVHSNDGVRVLIDGKRVFEDGEVHPDRMSPPIPVRIEQPGWYALKIMYFEKQGTATLELFWTPPGGQQTHVPAEAFGHVK